MHPMFTGVVSSTVTMIVVSLATQKSSPVPPHVLEMMDTAAVVGPIPEQYQASNDMGLANEAAAIGRHMQEGNDDG
jgi:sodium/proline symporter